MPKAIALLIAGMIGKVVLGFRSIIVRQFQGRAFHTPQIIMSGLGTGHQCIRLFLRRQVGDKVEGKVILRKVQGINQGKAELVAIKVEGFFRILDAQHGLLPGRTTRNQFGRSLVVVVGGGGCHGGTGLERIVSSCRTNRLPRIQVATVVGVVIGSCGVCGGCQRRTRMTNRNGTGGGCCGCKGCRRCGNYQRTTNGSFGCCGWSPTRMLMTTTTSHSSDQAHHLYL